MNGILEIQNLVVDYGVVRALKGIDMCIPEGKIVTVLGANGAGKTTTMHTISGMTQATSGKIIFDGEDITNIAPYKIAARRISQSPEGRLILKSLTTEENLHVGAYNIKSKAQIKKNLRDVYDLFPRLEERKSQQATTLSGGEQQMLAIGRAMMMNPRLLLLDEPSLGLAPLIIKDIFQAIKKIASTGVTVLMVEQNARQSLKVADYAYVLELGKIKTSGTSAEMLANDDLLNAYLGKQKG